MPLSKARDRGRKRLAKQARLENSQFQPDIPLYNPSNHKIDDRVLVYKGRRLVETVIPQIDADGNPIYEEE